MSDETDDARIRIANLILRLRRLGVMDQRVLAAVESVPRDLFVPAESEADAYADRSLPIDCGQTIAAPGIAGLMVAALDVGDRHRVLEVGTGTGYQTAILARLARRVYSVDRFRTLVAAAETRFQALRISNITTMVGDGMNGWPEQAPFDGIIVAASGEEVPPPLLKQVRVGGAIVMPIGPADGVQKLTRLVRGEGAFETTTLADVRFVPLIPGKAERL
jgi:protein-L-isoaspartate(D-aspartate) O-methyltransferase